MERGLSKPIFLSPGSLGATFLSDCAKGDLKAISRCLNDPSAQVWVADFYDRTGFHLACLNRHLEAVKLFLSAAKKRADINLNARDRQGQTAFFLACFYHDLELITILADEPLIDVNRPKELLTPFQVACLTGSGDQQLRTVRYLVWHPRIDRSSPLTHSLLHDANRRSAELVRLLLSSPGVDLEKKDSYQSTPFASALLCSNHGNGVIKAYCDDFRTRAQLSDVTNPRGPFTCCLMAGNVPGLKALLACCPLELPEIHTDIKVCYNKKGFEACLGLLAEYQENPLRLKSSLRRELGFHEQDAAELFALVIFLAEGLLELK